MTDTKTESANLTGLLPLSEGRPASGGRIHDFVVRTMGAWILGGRYKPGDVLPREDDLTESLGVSRTSLREAVKVLCAKGLLETRPRVGVRVQEREHWRLLDPDRLGLAPRSDARSRTDPRAHRDATNHRACGGRTRSAPRHDAGFRRDRGGLSRDGAGDPARSGRRVANPISLFTAPWSTPAATSCCETSSARSKQR